MSTSKPKLPVRPQPTDFQRFTIRLVDGQFVRVPKADLPSVEPQMDQSATSNQTEIRDLFRLVNGRFVPTRADQSNPTHPANGTGDTPLVACHRDPTFDLPE